MENNRFEKSQNVGYGEYGCCKCRKPLVGRYNFVGERNDEDGYDWRSFCEDCWKQIKNYPEEAIIALFPSSPCLVKQMYRLNKDVVITGYPIEFSKYFDGTFRKGTLFTGDLNSTEDWKLCPAGWDYEKFTELVAEIGDFIFKEDLELI